MEHKNGVKKGSGRRILLFRSKINANYTEIQYCSPSTGETQEDMNNVSCRRDMTEIMLKAA